MKELITARMDLDDNNVTIDGYVHYHIEIDYGSDADGNRGQKRVFVDDVTGISCYIGDRDIKLSEEDEDKAADILTRKFLEE